jgi:hypothetical protein
MSPQVFIKQGPSTLGSTTRIKNAMGVSARLIVAIQLKTDDWAISAGESGGVLDSRQWCHGTPVSP